MGASSRGPGLAPPPPPPRVFLFLDSPRASEALALSRHARSHTRTQERAPAEANRATRARAHRAREDGGEKRRKKGEGASHRRQLRQLPEPGQRAVREEPAAAAAPSRAGGNICIPAQGTGASGAGRAGDRAQRREPFGARALRGRVACARRTQPGPSRGQNEPRAGGRASARSAESRGGGSRRGKGVAGKTRIWIARGLRRAGST